MILRYTLPDGIQKEYQLEKKSITIGRSTDADLFLPDKLVSRIHCGISYWDNAYFIRDFKSRNSTLVNDRPVEVARLNSGDRIRVGDTILIVDLPKTKGTDTVLKEVKDAMVGGKGYHTILQEIIQEEKTKT